MCCYHDYYEHSSAFNIFLFNEHLTIQNDPPSQHTLYHTPHVLTA